VVKKIKMMVKFFSFHILLIAISCQTSLQMVTISTTQQNWGKTKQNKTKQNKQTNKNFASDTLENSCQCVK
jgi:uncharacterized protein YlxW (UPF0749 family)